MFPSLPPVTRALIIACVLMYVLQIALGDVVVAYLGLWPLGTAGAYTGLPGFQPWQLVTYSFLHDTQGITHLLFNMFALYMFGSDLERTFGQRRYLNLYLVSVIAAA